MPGSRAQVNSGRALLASKSGCIARAFYAYLITRLYAIEQFQADSVYDFSGRRLAGGFEGFSAPQSVLRRFLPATLLKTEFGA